MNKKANYFSKEIILFSFLNFVSFSIFAQPFYQKLFSNDTTSYRLKDIAPTSDGGTVILSANSSQVSAHRITCLTKIDCSGKVIWSKGWNLGTASHFFHGAVIETATGDIIATFSMDDINVSFQKYNLGIVKLDSNGEIIWEQQYGSPYYREASNTIIETSDNGFVISGEVKKQINDPFIDEFYFFKIDSLGNVIWSNTFGENDFSNHISASMEDEDGNLIFVGNNDNYDWDNHIVKGIIIKISPTGEVLFYREINNSNSMNLIKEITSTSDGDYLLSGYTTSADTTFNPFLLKINPAGEVIYTKKLSLNSNGDTISNYALIPLLDGGYALAGSAIGFPQYVNVAGWRDILYICTLNENEEYVGARVYNHNGVISNLDAFAFKARMDGGYNLGYTRFSPQTSSFPLEIGILHIDENFSSGCNDYDATDDFSLTTISNWTLEDKIFTNSSICEPADFEEIVQEFPISISTICESDLQANFSINNICLNNPIVFENSSLGPIIYQEWNFNEGTFISEEKNPTYSFTESGFFPIQLIVSDGCRMDTMIQEIEVPVEPCACNMIFPNAFTPDQDGLNDFFHPIIECDYQIENYNLMLFNRWGQVIFKTDNLEEKWDRNFKGKPVPMDVLVFKIQYDVIDWNGILIRQTNESGDVTLIR